MRQFLLLYAVLMKCRTLSAQLQAAITSPLIYNAYLYSQEPGTFTCVTRNSDDIRWIIDGAAHNHPSLDEKQIVVQTDNFAHSQHSVIMIPAIPVNQYITEIKCRAYTIFQSYQEVDAMETAQFNVQGLLDMPPNITYSSYNISHNLIEWLEPETLNITNVEPDIENYTICTNVTDECLNTTTTHFILPKYFVDIEINVTAWNIVGESSEPAQLEIKACIENVPSGKNYRVEVQFRDGNFTVLHVAFTNQHFTTRQVEELPFTNECVYLYEVTVYQRSGQSSVSTHQIYDYGHSFMLELLLPKNNLYTLHINRSSRFAHSSLNKVNFSTYDIQDVNITFEDIDKESVLRITYHLAAGAKIQGITIQLTRDEKVLQERSFNISEQCGLLPINSSPCLVTMNVELSQLFMTSNGNFNLSILIWDQLDSTNNVYFQEFILEAPIRETTYFSNAYTTSLSVNHTSDNTTENNVNTQSTALIVSAAVAMIVGGVLGMGTVCLICIFKKRTKKEGHTCSKESNYQKSVSHIIPNEAYSIILQMDQNEAYGKGATKDATNEPHLYDEIGQPPAVSTSDPMYAEIAEQPSKVKVL